MPGREIRCLTGIRGLAACFVVLYHYIGGAESLGPTRPVFLHGYIAVDLFFVLSGFVMALTYSASFATRIRAGDYAAFLGRRFCRIYPLYGFSVVLMIAATSVATDAAVPSFPAVTVVSNFLLVQSWGWPVQSINAPGWSISTECAAYLVFPVLVGLVLRGPGWRVAATAVAAMGALAWVATRPTVEFGQFWDGIAHRHGPLDAFGLSVHALLRCLAEFVLGLVGYRLAQTRSAMALAARPAAANLAVVTVLGLLAVPGSDLLLVGCFVPLVVTLGAETSFASRVVGCRPVHWLGLISYSMYLMTHVVEAFMRPVLESLFSRLNIAHTYMASGLAMLPVVVALSACTYYGIERPGRTLAQAVLRLGRRPGPAELGAR